MRCDYRAPLSHESCRESGEAACILTIYYDKHGINRHKLNLCAGCAAWVTLDARRHGYRVVSRTLKRR